MSQTLCLYPEGDGSLTGMQKHHDFEVPPLRYLCPNVHVHLPLGSGGCWTLCPAFLRAVETLCTARCSPVSSYPTLQLLPALNASVAAQ
jgi:hypothetical protein